MKIKNSYNTIVIGGGAGGLFFGAAASCPDVLILEKTNKTGTKLLMAGSGQCNLTHGGSIKEFLLCYGKNGKRLRSLLFKHNNMEMRDFFHSIGVETFEREDGKVFPVSLNSKDVKAALIDKINRNGTDILCSCEVKHLAADSDGFTVTCEQNRNTVIFHAQNLVIATGGMSYASTGSDGAMYRILAEDLDIAIVPPRPALSPITVQNYPFSTLSGISIKNAALKIMPQNISACGDLLFTFKGFSGPLILNNSRYIFTGSRVEINFIYPYTISEVIERIKSIFAGNPKQISTVLMEEYDIPKRFTAEILKIAGIADKKLSSVSGSEITRLANALAGMEFSVSGCGSFRDAMVTCGGVSLEEINLKTMESKKVAGLYFVGEVTDSDGDTGGYNLQFAYSSARAAADNIFK